jgi:hypothetical protein
VSHIELTAQEAGIVIAGSEHCVPRRQLAVDAQATQQRGPFNRSASPRLEHVARIAKTVRGDDTSKRRPGIHGQ